MSHAKIIQAIRILLSRSLQSTKPNEKKMKILLSQKNGWIWGISTLLQPTKPNHFLEGILL